MEVASVVLGAVPLITYALDNYQQTRETFQSFRRWKGTLETLKTDIFIQKRQLYATLRNLDIEVTEQTTMVHIENMLQISHPAQCDQLMHFIHAMDDLMNSLAQNLYPDAEGPPTLADARSARMSWEWRRVKRSFGTKERKQIVKQLQAWNLALQNCGLERREVLPDTENRIIDRIRKTYNEERTKAIRKNAQGLHKAINSGWGCTCVHGHRGNIQLNWHRDKPLNATAFQLALSGKPTSQAQNTTPDMTWKMITVSVEELPQLATTTVGNLPSPMSSSTATPSLRSRSAGSSTLQINSNRVRFMGVPIPDNISVRSGSPSPVPVTQPPNASPPASTQTPAVMPPTTLCDMLDPKLQDQVLGCIPIPGSNPRERIRIVRTECGAISSLAATKRTIRLHALLCRTVDKATNHRLALDRKQRFGVAAALAWAVLHLCDSPWLEEVLGDEDIHMFLEEESGSSIPRVSHHPYISYEFRRSAKQSGSSPQAGTASVQYQNNQIQNITLYTLAIRLIELGLNKPFTRLRAEYLGVATSTSLGSTSTSPVDDFEIAKQQIEELMLDPGPSYAYAVDLCLRFLFAGSRQLNTFEYGPFRSAFFANVIAPLQAVFELIPWSASQLGP